jgi:monoamine oxidase
MLPGLTKQWDGRAIVDYWTGYRWTLGSYSYSYYKPGQYTAFGGVEPEISDACPFCGEHTTQEFQGYLNGAVFSGERAAGEVLSAT